MINGSNQVYSNANDVYTDCSLVPSVYHISDTVNLTNDVSLRPDWLLAFPEVSQTEPNISLTATPGVLIVNTTGLYNINVSYQLFANVAQTYVYSISIITTATYPLIDSGNFEILFGGSSTIVLNNNQTMHLPAGTLINTLIKLLSTAGSSKQLIATDDLATSLSITKL